MKLLSKKSKKRVTVERPMPALRGKKRTHCGASRMDCCGISCCG